MTLVVVDAIVSRRDFGMILAGRIAGDGARSGESVRVKASSTALLGEPGVGETWSVEGEIEQTRWGPQIAATRAVRNLPSGRLMIDFLQTVGGIGRTRATRLWDAFEDRLPEALEVGDVAAIAAVMDPHRPVLGPRLAAAAIAAWNCASGQAKLVEWLAAAGLTDLKIVKRVHALLGDDAPARLQANPWCLVPLAPWSQVDELGLRLLREAGCASPVDDPRRLIGATDAVMKDAIAQGSTALTEETFREELAAKLRLKPSSPAIAHAHDLALRHRAVVPGNGLLRAPGAALMEDAVVRRLATMAAATFPEALRRSLGGFTDQTGSLHPEQADAVRRALSTGFVCLRGGAGTGKTHVARAICSAWVGAGGTLLLAAVAGKAALRLSRSTSRLARTLFRTIRELDEREGIERKIAAGGLDQAELEKMTKRLPDLAYAGPDTLCVIDESSMVDLPSLFGLLRRLPDGARLLMIGDEKQLPPVGFGVLFHRFVHDPGVTAGLTVIHRQAADSGIPGTAAALRRRELPPLPAYAGPAEGASLLEVSGREAIAESVKRVYDELSGDGEVLVVTPVNEGPCGVLALNRHLHDAYKARTGLQEMRGSLGEIFSPGEPVVHRRNDYKRGLFNGSMGKIKRIEPAAGGIGAVFDDE